MEVVTRMTFRVEVLFFHEAEELDVVGPWEVLRLWQQLSRQPIEVSSVSLDGAAVRCAHGLMVSVDRSVASHGAPDLLVVPGGPGAEAVRQDSETIQLLRRMAASGTLMASVCTGAQVLAEAGLLDGMRATTHWRALDALEGRYPAVTVERDVRWVDAGRVVTSAGVSAGIDMTLHLVARLETAEVAQQVARLMEYRWHPEL